MNYGDISLKLFQQLCSGLFHVLPTSELITNPMLYTEQELKFTELSEEKACIYLNSEDEKKRWSVSDLPFHGTQFCTRKDFMEPFKSLVFPWLQNFMIPSN